MTKSARLEARGQRRVLLLFERADLELPGHPVDSNACRYASNSDPWCLFRHANVHDVITKRNQKCSILDRQVKHKISPYGLSLGYIAANSSWPMRPCRGKCDACGNPQKSRFKNRRAFTARGTSGTWTNPPRGRSLGHGPSPIVVIAYATNVPGR